MNLINININKYFHMIPLWKSPSKLQSHDSSRPSRHHWGYLWSYPLELPVELPMELPVGTSPHAAERGREGEEAESFLRTFWVFVGCRSGYYII